MTNFTTGPMRRLEPVLFLGGLRYWVGGEMREGEGYLLIPGMGATLRHWTAVAHVLSDQHRTVAIDFPGLGPSKLRGQEATTADRIVDSVGNLLSHLALRPVHIVGHSLGAVLALALAARLDDGVCGVTLVDGILKRASDVVSRPREAVRDVASAQIAGVLLAQMVGAAVPLVPRLRSLFTLSYVREALLWPYVANPSALDPSLLCMALEDDGRLAISDLTLLLKASRSMELEELATRTRASVSLVWGDRDRLISNHDIDWSKRHLRVGRARELQECGHWPAIEQPGALCDFILESSPSTSEGP